jgi:hypothetical protein
VPRIKVRFLGAILGLDRCQEQSAAELSGLLKQEQRCGVGSGRRGGTPRPLRHTGHSLDTPLDTKICGRSRDKENSAALTDFCANDYLDHIPSSLSASSRPVFNIKCLEAQSMRYSARPLPIFSLLILNLPTAATRPIRPAHTCDGNSSLEL